MEKERGLKNVNGILFFNLNSTEAALSALNYKARPGDLFLTGYPRCGNTWLHYIVLSILWKGKVPEDPLMFFLGCPYLEWCGADCVNYMTKPGAIATHIPFHAIPYSSEAKYIYINRNPRDCCVSQYHFTKMERLHEKSNLSFDEYFEDFIRGNVMFGDYFDHVLEWYKHRNDSNVHFVTYENLKRNPRREILKIANFIGEEYGKYILENEKVMENILNYSSFENMKKDANKSMDMYFRCDNIFNNREIPSGLKASLQCVRAEGKKYEPITEFVRKGIIGDWKNYFKEDQLKRLEAKIEEKTIGTNIKILWKDIFDE